MHTVDWRINTRRWEPWEFKNKDLEVQSFHARVREKAELIHPQKMNVNESSRKLV